MSSKLLMHMGLCIGNEEVLRAGVRPEVGFSSPEFIETMNYCLKHTGYVLGTDAAFKHFIIPGGGTSAMESVLSFLSAGDRVLIASNGVFGERWKIIFDRYGIESDVISAQAGSSVLPEDMMSVQDDYAMACITHVETSTGVRAPVDELCEEAREHA